MAMRECQKKANRKWLDENAYTRTVTFFNSSFPVEEYNKAKEILHSQGISINEFFKEKLQELINKEERRN